MSSRPVRSGLGKNGGARVAADLFPSGGSLVEEVNSRKKQDFQMMCVL